MAIKSEQSFAQRGGWWVIAQAVLFGLILVALRYNNDPAPALQIVGWVAVAAAIAIGGSGAWMIRRKITAMPAPLSGAVLMQSGPYSVVRHPIYTGVIIGFVGLSIKGGNLAAFLLSLLLVPFFFAKTTHEENLLGAEFPEYADYKLRVRSRVLPWVL